MRSFQQAPPTFTDGERADQASNCSDARTPDQRLPYAGAVAARRNPLTEFFSGVGMLGRGFKVWATAPKLMFLGLIPALIVGAIYLAAAVALIANLENLSRLSSPFANEWDPFWATVLRVALMVAFLAVFLVLWVYTFTAVTLIVGDWFYEKIWNHVEHQLGHPPTPPQTGFWRQFGRAVADLLRLLIPTALFGILIFAVGFIPVVGAVLSFVFGAFIGGWFFAVETTGLSFDGRGIRLRDRRRTLRSRRALALGFGVASYLVFLIPGGAVIGMPAAVAGATMLSRRILDDANAQSSVRTSASSDPRSGSRRRESNRTTGSRMR